MRQDFLAVLQQWRKESLLGEVRQIRHGLNKTRQGEHVIHMSMQIRVTFKSSRDLVKTSYFYTFAQSETDPFINPAGDIYRFRQHAAKFEKDFFEEHERLLTEMIQDDMPDGFLDM